MSARLRRLQAEYERLNVLFQGHDRIRIAEAVGDPPAKYIIEYRVRGLAETKVGVEERILHRVQITLGPDYPRVQPRCVALDPVFHPNINYLAICTADVSSAGQKLEDTIIFISEMIMYQTYNLKSTLNGDAKVWTEQNLDRLPLENIELRPRAMLEGAELPVMPVPRVGTARLEPEPVSVPVVEIAQPRCANCGRVDAAAGLQSCTGGHLACSDCLLGCSNCGRMLCALCDVGSCAECRRPVCSDCVAVCSCSRRVCPEHAWQCPTCRSIRCRRCPAPCRGCGTLYCQEHLDDGNLCPACQPKEQANGRPASPGDVVNVDRLATPAPGDKLTRAAESHEPIVVSALVDCSGHQNQPAEAALDAVKKEGAIWSPRRPALIRRDPMEALRSSRMIAAAFHASIVLIALGLFVGIFFLAGGVRALTKQNALFFVPVLAVLSLFYRYLWVLANRASPAKRGATRRLVDGDSVSRSML